MAMNYQSIWYELCNLVHVIQLIGCNARLSGSQRDK